MLEESEGSENENGASEGLSPGQILTQAREEAGLTRLRVSELLGLTQGAIRDIELGRFDKFPSGIYTRGYIRNYSKLVGADEEQVLVAYDRYGETHEVPEESPFGHSAAETSDSSAKKQTIFLVVGILIIVAICIYVFK